MCFAHKKCPKPSQKVLEHFPGLESVDLSPKAEPLMRKHQLHLTLGLSA